MTAISRIVRIAGAASMSPSRASARSCALRLTLVLSRPGIASRRAVVAITPPFWGRNARYMSGRSGAAHPVPAAHASSLGFVLPLLHDVPHLVRHLLDRLLRLDLLRHRLPEGRLDRIGGHLRVERGH